MCGGSPLIVVYLVFFLLLFSVKDVGEIHRVELCSILRSPLSEPESFFWVSFCTLITCRGDSQERRNKLNSRSPLYETEIEIR